MQKINPLTVCQEFRVVFRLHRFKEKSKLISTCNHNHSHVQIKYTYWDDSHDYKVNM